MRDRQSPETDTPVGFEEIQRVTDRRAPARSARESELLARQLGLSPEELDRRLQADDARRDAAGMPAMATAAVRERAGVDDFGAAPADSQATLPRGGRHDDAGHSPRLSERANRIVARDSDVQTAAAVAALAQQKGWPALKVSGSPEFCREVWLQAQSRGIDVRGYKPTQADQAELDRRRELHHGAKPGQGPRRETGGPGLAQEQVTRLRKAQQADQDYQRLTPGSRERIDKARVVEAVAAEVAVQKIPDPRTRQRVLNEVHRQLTQQSAKGKDVPTLHAVDRNAPARARGADHGRGEREPNQDRDKDRTR